MGAAWDVLLYSLMAGTAAKPLSLDGIRNYYCTAAACAASLHV
jgi:hypothetical protein